MLALVQHIRSPVVFDRCRVSRVHRGFRDEICRELKELVPYLSFNLNDNMFTCAMHLCSSGAHTFRTADFCCRIVGSSVPTGASSSSHLARKHGLSRAVRPFPKRPFAGNTRFNVLKKNCTWFSVLTAVALKYRLGTVLELSSLVATFHTGVCTGAAQGEASVAAGAAKYPP